MKIYYVIQHFIFAAICATLPTSLYGMSYQQQEKSQIDLDISLYNAIKKHDSQNIPSIITQGADVEGTIIKGLFGNLTPLDIAVLTEDITIIQLLIGYGADIDYKNGQEYTALDLALEKYLLCMHEYARAKLKPTFFVCCRQTIINEIEEHLDALKVIIIFLKNATTEPISTERAQEVLLLTLDNIIEHNALDDTV
jgi:hypothetical protein